MRRCLLVLVLLALTACGDGTGGPTQQPDLDEAGFWELVEDVRLQADGDPEAMAEDLTARLADADEETLRGFRNDWWKPAPASTPGRTGMPPR